MSLDLEGYKEFQELRNHEIRPRDLGFNGRTGDVNRLQARVRMAKSFEGIALREYGETTAHAYGAIFRVFLSFTAFEVFTFLTDSRYWLAHRDFPHYPYRATADLLSAHDREWKFTDALIRHTDNEYIRDSLERFKVGEVYNPLNHAAAIRHIFAHGHLTAHTHGSNPNAVAAICDGLSELLLDIIDGEFVAVVMREYERVIRGGV